MSQPATYDRVFPGPFRVLVVEDNAPDVMLITEALNEQGLHFEMTHYGDGDEVIAHLAGLGDELNSYDLVILDLNMPRVGGMEVLSRFRGAPAFREVPILVLTSSLSPEERAEADRLGVDSYLKKPADLYEFLSSVGETAKTLITSRRVNNCGH